MSITLTLEDFQKDVESSKRYDDPEYPAVFKGILKSLVTNFYSHIQFECIDWLKKEQGIELE